MTPAGAARRTPEFKLLPDAQHREHQVEEHSAHDGRAQEPRPARSSRHHAAIATGGDLITLEIPKDDTRSWGLQVQHNETLLTDQAQPMTGVDDQDDA